ncbi:uncharacterized protein EV420DRAFT_304722 [Desarmillaria tabescens]|uniref:BTB domain-containing protein n=1 Tax=Armillaria tabescens TaxID=1929756 RepID=A0AA39KDJ0_ARMTA|nr:uncharacterized protein EV420DRAFT_304722 [Desarmillaria tabescens]KAK0459130.1 hypothetical protein EV420DRAFT_304722 [Desarmillaria tabescens]
MASQQDSSFVALRHHDEYHLSGGDLFFLVEQYHFRVHRYFFERESTFFKHQLATPASPGEERQGTSEGTAIVLDHVTPAEFARFLWVFYNPSVVKCVFSRHPALTSNHSKYSLYDASVEDWAIILKLADRWCFPEVKNLAVRELEKHLMDDIDRIVVYQKYNVDKHLLIPRYAALCARTETLTLAEGIRLGMETALNIARARECARSPSVDGLRSPTSVALPSEEMHGIIVDLFSISEAPDSVSKGQENGSSTASSSTTGGSEMRQPRTPLTETPPPSQTGNPPTTLTKTDETVLSPVPAVEGDESPDEVAFEADENEEYWDDTGSDSDTHVDNAGVDSEKVYGDVDDGPVENVVDPQDNDDARDLDKQLHDPTPDAGVGDAPPESSAQDSRDDNDAGASHEINGEPDHGDGGGDGQDDSSIPSNEEVEKDGEQSTDVTLDATSEVAERKEDDGSVPIGEPVSLPNPTVDSSSVPETRADAGHGSGDDFPFDFIEPSGLGSMPKFDFNFDSTFDHIDIPNITVHSPTASHAGTEAGDESIEAGMDTKGRDQESEGDAKDAAVSSSDTVTDAGGPEGALTTEPDAGIAEGTNAEGNEDDASNGDDPNHTPPPSDETTPEAEDDDNGAASGDDSSGITDPLAPESKADEATPKPEESSSTAEGNSDDSPALPTQDSSANETAPKPEHDGEPSTVPADEDPAFPQTAKSTEEDVGTDTKVPFTADTPAFSSDPPADSSSPTLPPLPPDDDLLEGHDTPGRTRRPTLSIDTAQFWGKDVLGPTHAGHATGENGDGQPADAEEKGATPVVNPIEPPPIVQDDVPTDLDPLVMAANLALPEESESEDDPNEQFYDSPEGPAAL